MDNLNLTKYFHRSLLRIPESVNKCMDTIQTNVYNFPKISALSEIYLKEKKDRYILWKVPKKLFCTSMMIIHLSKINLLNPLPWSDI